MSKRMSRPDTRLQPFLIKPLAVAVAIASGGVLHAPSLSAQVVLPTGPNIKFGAANITLPNANTMNIQQGTDKAIIDWESFSIGQGGRVDFIQNNANSIALNRVTGVSPSMIAGMLNANGRVYLINRNGIIFSGTAQINTGGLVASTLDIDDELFKNGSINTAINEGKPAFEVNGFANEIKIEEGAQLKTASGGTILIFAPNISNSGTIETPDGQTILAAAQDKVYLTVSDRDDDYRGLLVEVQTGGTVTNEQLGKIIAERGNITLLGMSVNQNGRVRATTSVDLNGTVRLLARDGATVKIADNGNNHDAIQLGFDTAGDAPSSTRYALASRSGNVTFGKASVTEIQPDLTDIDTAADGVQLKTAPNAQPQNPSRVEVMGKTIEMQEDSKILAPSAEVAFIATETPDQIVVPNGSEPTKSAARVHLAAGSTIDVSGLENVELDMSRNVLEVELRGNELKDSPLQRDGILRGKKVKIDLRNGTDIAIADISGALAAVKRDVRERMTTGGKVDIKSTGDVVLAHGSKIDVSGGSVKYKAGKVESTKLLSNGKIYDISDADPNLHYDAILGQNEIDHEKWNVVEVFTGMNTQSGGVWVEGFTEGKNAGAVAIDSHALIMEGDIKAGVVTGEYQRDIADAADGGSLDVSLRRGQNSLQELRIVHDRTTHDIGANDQLVVADDIAAADGVEVESDPPPRAVLVDDDGDGVADLLVSDDMLSQSGLGKIRFAMNGDVSIEQGADLQLADGASLSLAGTSVEHAGRITSHGGDVQLQADLHVSQLAVESDGTVNQFPVHLAAGSRIDVSGRFTNDAVADIDRMPSDAVAVDAGSVKLQARGALAIDAGAEIDADGGAHIKRNRSVAAGEGGDVTVISRVTNGADVTLDGDISAYALEQGGKLSVEAASIVIGDAVAAATADTDARHVLHLDNGFFTEGGFNAYAVTANLDALIVDSTANLSLQAQNRVLKADGGYLLAASGGDLANLSTLQTVPDYLRAATDIDLILQQRAGSVDESGQVLARTGDFVVESGARIGTDIGGNILLQSDNSLFIDGALDAAGGSITARTVSHADATRGYDAGQSLWIGENARLTSNAAVEYMPNVEGRREGELFDAGAITLDANRGYVMIEQGAVLEASGAAVQFDTLTQRNGSNVVATQIVAADAGKLELRAAEGMIIDGTLLTSRANVEGARGGELTVAVDTDFFSRIGESAANPYPVSSPVVRVDGKRDAQLAGDMRFGDALAEGQLGVVELDANAINAMQLDTLTLDASNKSTNTNAGDFALGRIEFEQGATLTTQQRIDLTATTLRVNDNSLAKIDSSAIVLGVESDIAQAFKSQQTTTPVAGNGTFVATADFIDVSGNVSVDNVAELALASTGDIRLRSVVDTSGRAFATGNLVTTGDITLLAQQIYPSTLTDYRIASSGDTTTITVARADGTAITPLSAAGKLTLDATHIDQQGVLKAPLGQIALGGDNTESVRLADGSVTSVAADGNRIPLGRIQGEDVLWSYGIDQGQPLVINDATLPEKTVAIKAADVDLQEGSVVDVSGSAEGDVYATEFITGPGGSKDVLAGENAGDSFAIVPALKNGYAPYDIVESRNTDIELGKTLRIERDVRLADGSILPAGEYTVLPARYALQTGAFLITPAGTGIAIDPSKNQTRTDGAQIVAGKFGISNTAIEDSQWSGFVIENGAVALTRSEYVRKTATEYFAGEKALYSMPGDAGLLAVSALHSIELDGELKAGFAADGKKAKLDIEAENLLVVRDDFTGDDGGAAVIRASDLSSFGADSVLLGGTRERVGSGDENEVQNNAVTGIDVLAQQVTLEDGAELQGAEFLFAARESVNIGDNARIGTDADSGATTTQSLLIDGDGALLQVSALQRAVVSRTSETGATGAINVGEGATLAGERSIVLDASANIDLAGSLSTDALTVSSSRIVLGSAPENTNGVALGVSQLDALDPSRLILRSRSDITVTENIQLAADDLLLQAGNIVVANAANAVFDATGLLTLEGLTLPEGGSQSQDATDAGGNLVFNADVVQLGAHDDELAADASLALAAESVTLNATSGVLLDDALSLTAAGDVVMAAPHITANKAAQTSISSDGTLTLAKAGADNALMLLAADLGAKLSLAGSSLAVDTHILLPSGAVAATAELGDIALGNNARVDVAGVTQTFDREKVASAGGDVTLIARAGNVRSESGSTIDVSGAALSATQGSRAGTLTISTPQGDTLLQGNLQGDAIDNADGGELVVDAKTIGAFDTLLAQTGSGGFSGAIDLRTREGDIAINEGQLLQADDIRLVADTGAVTIAGKLDATGTKGGRITIASGADATLTSTAVFDAHATTSDGRGGQVSIGSRDGELALQQGASIDVSGGDNSATNDGRNSVQQGSVHLRARRTVSTDPDSGEISHHVAVDTLDANVTGAARIELEAFDDGVQVNDITTALMDALRTEVDDFMSQAGTIISTLGALGSHEKFALLPGVEIRSDGDLNVVEEIDLSGWRFGDDAATAAPGVLTLRAAGNLNINQTINDGFIIDGTPPAGINKNVPVIMEGASWSLNLVAGADLASAAGNSTVKTLQDGIADVVIGPDVTVRTGTGDIRVAAGGDVRFASQTSTLYTAGHTSYYDYVNPYYTGSGSQPQSVYLPYTGFLYQRYVNTVLPDRFMYPHEGGDIDIEAGSDVRLAESRQLSSDWLQRYIGEFTYGDRSQMDPETGLPIDVTVEMMTWGIVASDFQQGIATLGGGDIRVRAGNDIEHLSASAPITLRQSSRADYDAGILPLTGDIVRKTDDYVYEINGGGDIDVRAGNDVLSARILADKGAVTVIAGGAIESAAQSSVIDTSGNPIKAYTMVSLSNATARLAARGDIDIDAIYNTTALPLSSQQEDTSKNFLFTYDDAAAVYLDSDAGDIRFSNTINSIRFESTFIPVGRETVFTMLPSSLHALAHAGSIYVDNSMTLFPSVKGDLGLLAREDISTAADNIFISVSDADPALLPTLPHPGIEASGGLDGWIDLYASTFLATALTPEIHAASPLHSGDTDAVTLIAARGDIDGDAQLSLYSAKKLYAHAGDDITNMQLYIQNNNAYDISVVSAGDDISFEFLLNDNGTLSTSISELQIAGPGQLHVIAGDDISLGSSNGIVSVGNTRNPALAETGADITALTGVGEGFNYDGFASSYLDYRTRVIALARGNETALAAHFGVSSLDQALLQFDALDGEAQYQLGAALYDVDNRDYTDAMIDYLFSDRVAQSDVLAIFNTLFDAELTDTTVPYLMLKNNADIAQKNEFAMALFDAIDIDYQRSFMLDVMYSEIRKGGIENAKGLTKNALIDGFNRSYAAIDTLFDQFDQRSAQSSVTDPGNLSLVFSQIKTMDGGGVNFVLPTGQVNVGLAGDFAGFNKSSGDLGIVAQGSGSINGITYDDINVNKSRIFALDGGDIMLWSSQHDIDAGKGAKTALTIPPPRVTVDSQGNIKTEFPAAISGSGIQAAVMTPGRDPGDVYLFAPAGIVDAGDAGISSDGDILIAATKVLGADNISFGGVAIGVPTSTSIASSLAGVSDAASSSTASATDDVADKSSGNCDEKEGCEENNAVAFVTVEIIGLGD